MPISSIPQQPSSFNGFVVFKFLCKIIFLFFLSPIQIAVAQPVINSFSPVSGPIGTTVTITGTGFDPSPTANLVYFGAVKAIVNVATATSLTVMAPPGSSYEPMTVTVNGLIGYAAKPFLTTFANSASLDATTFATINNFGLSGPGNWVGVGDINGDGKPDVVTVGNNATITQISVLINTSSAGSLTFDTTNVISLSSAQYPYCLLIQDMDGDGKKDIITAALSDTTFSVYRNTSLAGAVSFAQRQTFAGGKQTVSMAIGDLDNDGRPDVILTNDTYGGISIARNTGTTGNIAFTQPVRYLTGTGPSGVCIARLNGDDLPDIAVTNGISNTVSVFKNLSTSGSILLDTKTDLIAPNAYPKAISAADLNNDDKLDLIVSNGNSSYGYFVYVNTSTGAPISFNNFRYELEFGLKPSGTCITDMDGDGKPDIVSGYVVSVSKNRTTVAGGGVALNTYLQYASNSSPNACVVDMDGDSKPDIITSNGTSGVGVFRNKLGEPVITSFAPVSAAKDTVVVITGVNFSGATAVQFGGVPAASFTVVSATRINAVIPAGMPTGFATISVTTAAGNYQVEGLTLNVPAVGSIAPASAVTGTTVTITGNNFNTTPQNNTVHFGNVKATVTSATATTLTATVPSSTVYKPLTLSTNNLTGSSTTHFVPRFGNSNGADFDSISFGAGVPLATGQIHTVADFDGDGKPDLAVINSVYTEFAIYRNISTSPTIAFGTKTVFPVRGQVMNDICTGDFNGDGKLDIVISNFTYESVSVFINTSSVGTISFAPRTDYATGNSYTTVESFSVATADIDSDGRMDIIVGTISTDITILRNTMATANSPVTFANAIQISIGNSYGASYCKLVVGEIDGDGKPDIALVQTFSSNITILRNNSSPGVVLFSPKIGVSFGLSSTTSSAQSSIALGDLDGDGKLDIAAACKDSMYLSVLLNVSTAGSISFAPIKKFTAENVRSLAIADIDGDGKPDLAGISTVSIHLLRNTSNIGVLSFQPKYSYKPASNFSIANNFLLADLDGDSKPEILIEKFDSYNGNSIFYARNYINGPLIYSYETAVAEEGTTVIIRGNRFTGTTAVSFGGTAAQAYVVVSDTVLNAVVSNGSSGDVLVTTSGGIAAKSGFVFSNPIPRISSITPGSGTTGSSVTISGSRFGSSPSQNAVFFGTIKGTIKGTITAASTNAVTVTVPTGAPCLPISITTNNRLTAATNQPYNFTFDNTGIGLAANSFTKKVSYPSTDLAWNIHAADIDGDGKPELLFSNFNIINSVSILRNNSVPGIISFTGKIDSLTRGGPARIVVGDLNGDNKPELLTASSDTVYAYSNNSIPGTIAFTAKLGFQASQYINDVLFSDLDDDGRPDIITSGNVTGVSVLRNQSYTGVLSFAAKKDLSAPSGSTDVQAVVADFDGDGKKDVLTTNGDANSFSTWRNLSTTGTLSFSARTDYAAGSKLNAAASGDFDGDGKPDLVIVSAANLLSVYKNTSPAGTIAFASRINYSIPGTSNSVVVTDMDGDGKPDIILSFFQTNDYNDFAVYKNTSTGSTISFIPFIYPHSIGAIRLAVADFDGDNKPDIACTNDATRTVSVFRNQVGETDINLCPPIANTSLSSGLSGGSYQWQISTDSVNYSNLSNSANFSGTNTSVLQLTNFPLAWYGYRFRCIGSNGTSNLFTTSFANTWTGTASSSWENAANWSCGTIPDANTDVVINSGTVIISSNTTVRSLKISLISQLRVKTGYNLTVLR